MLKSKQNVYVVNSIITLHGGAGQEGAKSGKLSRLKRSSPPEVMLSESGGKNKGDWG